MAGSAGGDMKAVMRLDAHSLTEDGPVSVRRLSWPSLATVKLQHAAELIRTVQQSSAAVIHETRVTVTASAVCEVVNTLPDRLPYCFSFALNGPTFSGRGKVADAPASMAEI